MIILSKHYTDYVHQESMNMVYIYNDVEADVEMKIKIKIKILTVVAMSIAMNAAINVAIECDMLISVTHIDFDGITCALIVTWGSTL
jgi:hypothetical protein